MKPLIFSEDTSILFTLISSLLPAYRILHEKDIYAIFSLMTSKNVMSLLLGAYNAYQLCGANLLTPKEAPN